MKKSILSILLFGAFGQLRAQTLVANPQDNQHEGGELVLERSNSNYNGWHIDNYQGYLRFHHDGSSYFSMDPNGNSKLTNNFSVNSLFIASENALPSEGSIGEGDWGNYILTNNTTTRTLRLGVSNDGYTRAEIEVENNNSPSGNIFFKTSNVNGGANVRMKIASNGNVGIGTTNPTSILEVKSTNNNGVKFNNNNTPSVSFLPNDGDSHFHISHTLDNRLTISHGLNVGGTKLFTIVNNGGVGIGTTNPGSYKLAVKGKIRAEEIKVETGWADYVFKEDYDLPTLEEVKDHIEEKGHLINIPSAIEVKENGIQLGEMNKLLLEKIEELTLYTLEQEKNLKSKNKRIDELEKRLEKIEEFLNPIKE